MKDHAEIVQYFMEIFDNLKTARQPHEDMWKECGRNYRGEYNIQPESSIGEGQGKRSRVFVKLTGQKCHTIHAKIVDSQLNGKEVVPYSLGYGDLPEGMTPDKAIDYVTELKKLLDADFIETRLDTTYITFMLGWVIYGSAVMKDPVMRSKYVRKWTGKRTEYVKESYYTQEIVHLLNYYADFHKCHPSEGIAEIQVEKIFVNDLQMLKDLPGYDKTAIDEAIKEGAVIDCPDDMQPDILGNSDTGKSGKKDEGYYIYEAWGLAPRDMLEKAGVSIPSNIKEDMIEVCCTVVNKTKCIKLEVNTMGYRPFLFVPFQEIPGQAAGQGVAWAVRDMQTLINVFTRMLVDNKKLTSQGMLAVNHALLDTARTPNLDVESGKIIYTKGNVPVDQVVKMIKFEDVSTGLMQLIELFLKFADDETVPKYTQGGGDSFLNKTATGISMLLTQSMINLKTPMKNLDHYYIRPTVERRLDRIEEMSSAPFIVNVIAKGSDSLMAKEMKLEKIMQFNQLVASNPRYGMMVDEYTTLSEAAEILEIDAMHTREDYDKAVVDAQEAAKNTNDWREFVKIEAMYPMITRNEQVQVLEKLGIEPDEVVEEKKMAQLQEAANAEQAAMKIGALAHETERRRDMQGSSGNSPMATVPPGA